MRCLLQFLGAIGVTLAVIAAGLWGLNRYVQHRLDPDPQTIATASLKGLQAQNKLSAFTAQYVAVVTSKQTRLGLSTQKTLIMPGLVRYEVDLGKLRQRDVRWDRASGTLSVTLPPIETDPPQVDLARVREYGDGGLLATFTNAPEELDAANRAAAQNELTQQARAPAMITLARDATRRAIERSFAMPLAAAGIDAKVHVSFADEAHTDDRPWDVSRSVGEVLGNGG
ncbi:MAG: DUF4230 domain-containing protein [Sphingomonas sp.]|uniref:DUF4230 domain-containing protein n=1 Tax=Sphingomonas sp. TaxID=28214 RepID=UPI003F41B11B